jgi:hypothetical protein
MYLVSRYISSQHSKIVLFFGKLVSKSVPYHKEKAMTSYYEVICEENRHSYNTKDAQKSGKLAAGLYGDRTHFIFELLQNTEDAIGR